MEDKAGRPAGVTALAMASFTLAGLNFIAGAFLLVIILLRAFPFAPIFGAVRIAASILPGRDLLSAVVPPGGIPLALLMLGLGGLYLALGVADLRAWPWAWWGSLVVAALVALNGLHIPLLPNLPELAGGLLALAILATRPVRAWFGRASPS